MMKQLLAFIILFLSIAPAYAGEAPKLTKSERGIIQEILKSKAIKDALLITKVADDDGDEKKVVKAKLRYLIHLNQKGWPVKYATIKNQYLYLKRINVIWSLEGLQDARALSLDELMAEREDTSYFLTGLAFHNGDVEAKFNELKEKDAVDADDIEFFTKAIRFRKQLRGSNGLIQTFYGGVRRFFSVTFSPNGKFVAASDNHKKISVWRVGRENSSPVYSIQTFGGYICSMQFLPKGERILALTNQGEVQEWNLKKPTEIKERSIPGISESHWYMSISGNRKRFTLARSTNLSFPIYEVNNQGDLFLAGITKGIWGIKVIKSIALSNEGKHIAVGYGLFGSGIVHVMSTEMGRAGSALHHNFAVKGFVTALAFSPDNKYLAVASKINIRIFNLKTKKPVQIFTGHTKEITSLAYSHDGKLLGSASEDSTVKVWKVKESVNPDIRLLSLEMPSKIKKGKN